MKKLKYTFTLILRNEKIEEDFLLEFDEKLTEEEIRIEIEQMVLSWRAKYVTSYYERIN